MSTLINELQTTLQPAQRLRAAMAAVRVSVHWLGVRRSLTQQQVLQAADAFGAEDQFLCVAKKVLDTAHPTFQAVTAVRSRLQHYWKGVSLPFPEPGVRLIRRDCLEDFVDRIQRFQEELREAVEILNNHRGDLQTIAQRKLGHLYNPADYPASLIGLFGIEFDFPSVEPPNYLEYLHPELYRRECERVQRQFDAAVQLAEDAFTHELSKLVSHLTERLAGHADGKPKIFRDTALEHLTDFFNRFRQLNIRSNEELDHLVDDAQRIVQDIAPNDLRQDAGLRQQVATELSRVQSVLDGLLVDRPRRNILRRVK